MARRFRSASEIGDGGTCGWRSAARSAASRATRARSSRRAGSAPAFPWGTLLVNVAGSFAIGLLAALVTADGRPALGADARAFVMVGVLGGFTTFSSFSLETLDLARSGALGSGRSERGGYRSRCASPPCGSASRAATFFNR